MFPQDRSNQHFTPPTPGLTLPNIGCIPHIVAETQTATPIPKWSPFPQRWRLAFRPHRGGSACAAPVHAAFPGFTTDVSTRSVVTDPSGRVITVLWAVLKLTGESLPGTYPSL
jgi:hypothetical protein